MTIQFPVIASGRWLYNGSKSLQVRVVLSPLWTGTGDEEDEPSICDDAEIPTYIVEFETVDGVQWSGESSTKA